MHLALVLACTAAPSTDSGATDGDSEAGPDGGAIDPGPAEFVFSYALIADPHVTAAGERVERLVTALDWIEAEREERGIELVFILGDIAWSEGWDEAVAAFQALSIPWLPVQGDNPIQVGEEAGFEQTFGPELAELGTSLDGWSRAALPVDDPVNAGQAWLQNYAFDHRGLRFIALDWNSRMIDPLWGETPDLHDFEGGTLPFLRGELQALGEGLDERVVLLTHMPMIQGPGSFDVKEGQAMIGTLGPYAELVYANHAGHLHGSAEGSWDECGMLVDTTDATWDDIVSLRVVGVSQDRVSVHYANELIELE